MNALAICLLSFAASTLDAAPVRATIRQQAEIITYIEQARLEVDDSGGDKCKDARNLSYCRAKRDKLKLENDMGILHDDRDNPKRSPTEEDLKKISGLWDHRGEDYAKAVRICQEAQGRADELYKKAIVRTIEAYNISPEALGGQVTLVNGQPWLIARLKTIAWSPKVSKLPELKSPPDQYPPVYETDEDFKGRPGFIRERDGAIIIREAAFIDHLERPDPGYLASVLRHEELHLRDFSDSGKDLKIEPLVEIRHRVDMLFGDWGGEDIYELSAYAWKQELKNIAWQADLKELWMKEIYDNRKDPYNEGDNRLIFQRLHITKERQDEIDRQVEHDLGVFEDAEKMGPGPEALEYVRAHAQSNFLNFINNIELRGAIDNWKKARELESRRPQKEAELLVARIEIEAERCGFDALNKGNRHKGGFHQKDNDCPKCSGTDYYYKNPVDMDAAKVGFLLARACYDSWFMRDYKMGQPCNDGLDTINRRWNDAAFRNMLAIEAGGLGGQEDCLRFLVGTLQAPVELKSLEKAAKRAWKEGPLGGSPPSSGNNGRDRGSDDSSGGSRGDRGDRGGIDPKPGLPHDRDWDGRAPH